MLPYLLKKFGRPRNTDGKMERAREDLLTGLCLGSMRYLPSDYLLIPFLRSFPHLSHIPICEDNLQLTFWPTWPNQQALLDNHRRIEPDWVIESSDIVVVGESKYHSDFSLSQLRREWRLAHHLFGAEKTVYLAGISSHLLEPDISEKLDDIAWLWTNWRSIVSLINDALTTTIDHAPYRKRFLKDLRDALHGFGIYEFYIFDINIDAVDLATFSHAYRISSSTTTPTKKSFSRIATQLPVNISSIPGDYPI